MTCKFLRGLVKKCFREVADNNRYGELDFLDLLLEAAQKNGFLEGTCRAVSGACDAETLFNRLEGVDYQLLVDRFKEDVRSSLRGVKLVCRNRKMTLAADVTHESYYGSHPNNWVHNQIFDKGAEGSYLMLVLSVLTGTRREVIGLLPLQCEDNACEFLVHLLDELKGRLRIDGLLLDRGFDSRWLIRELKRRRIPFLMLWRKSEYCRQVFREMGKRKWRRLKHSLPLDSEEVTFTLVFVKGIKVGDDEKAYNWVFATNMRKGKPIHYIYHYKKRWGIETLFRILDELRIKTKTKNITRRLFLLLVDVYLYNTWKEILTALNYHICFSEYTTHLHDILEEIHPRRPPTLEQLLTREDIKTALATA